MRVGRTQAALCKELSQVRINIPPSFQDAKGHLFASLERAAPFDSRSALFREVPSRQQTKVNLCETPRSWTWQA